MNLSVGNLESIEKEARRRAKTEPVNRKLWLDLMSAAAAVSMSMGPDIGKERDPEDYVEEVTIKEIEEITPENSPSGPPDNKHVVDVHGGKIRNIVSVSDRDGGVLSRDITGDTDLKHHVPAQDIPKTSNDNLAELKQELEEVKEQLEKQKG